MIRILLTLTIILIAWLGQAQPVNDVSANAIEVPVNNYCSSNGEFTTMGATADGTVPSTWSGVYANVWFKFQATTTNVSIELKTGSPEGTLRWSQLSLHNAGLAELVSTATNGSFTDIGLSYEGLTVGNWYYINVDNGASASQRGTFTLCVDNTSSMDYPSGAEVIPHMFGCSVNAAYTTNIATPDGAVPSQWSGVYNNVWFKFQATTQSVSIDLKTGDAEGTLRWPQLALHDNGLTELISTGSNGNFADVGLSYEGLTIGNWYYINIDNGAVASQRGTFTLCVDNTSSMDYPSGAEEVSHAAGCSANAAYTTNVATPDGAVPSQWSGVYNNVWFKFQATTSSVSVDLKTEAEEGTLRHPQLALHDAGLTELISKGSNGTFVDIGFSYEGLTVGEWYYINVDNGSVATHRGTFTLCVNNTLSMDYPSGAEEIPHTADWCSGDAAYTTDIGTPNGVVPSEWQGVYANVWFKFQATTTRVAINVKTGDSEGTMRYPQLALHDTGLAELISTGTNGAFVDIGLSYEGLTVGNWYYIHVDNGSIDTHKGTFTLCVDTESSYDHPSGAVELPVTLNWCSGLAEYTTEIATADGTAPAQWNEGPNNNVWFRFLAQSTEITIDLKTGDAEGSMRYPKLALHDASLTVLSALDDAGSVTDLQLVYSSLIVGSWYYIQVDSGPLSNHRGTFTLCLDRPLDLADPTTLNVTNLAHDYIDLIWQDNSQDETGFSIERSANAVTGFVEIGTTGKNITSYRDTGLTAGTLYYYRIKAIGPGGTSGYSNTLEVSTVQNIAANTTLTHEARFNGSITAIKWRNYGDDEEKLYTYHYDKASRLTAAHYATGRTVTDTWTTTAAGAFSIPGIQYDPNGNITSLNRQAKEGDIRTIDALSYAYTGGNQLASVTDLTGWSGFADKHITGDDYAYDANGNLIKDENQGISSILYNHIDLPERINKTSGEYILYIYDASGAKLFEEQYNAASELIKRTDYRGEFVFENDELKQIHHEEGRILPDATTGGFEYQYFLRDHLGNNRVVVSAKPKTHNFTVDYEESGTDDAALFEEVTSVGNDLFDHTDAAGTVYTRAHMLNAMEGSRIGSVIALPVRTGDVLTASVFAKYVEISPDPSDVMTSLASSLIGAFTGSSGAVNETGNGTINGNFGNGSLIGTTGFPLQDANAPMAFLNVMFLPENEVITLEKDVSFAYDQLQAGATQAIGAPKNTNYDELRINNFVVPGQGYLLVYLSNESNTLTEVYFDDLTLELHQHNVTQVDDYYPFGLTFNSFQRPELDKNEYLYQGKEELEGTDWYDFHARSYHAALGRFMQVDPAGQFASTYVGMGNDPVNLIDPTGMFSFGNFLKNNTFLKGAFQLMDVINTRDEYGSEAARHLAGQYAKANAIEGAVALATAGVGSAVSGAVQSGALNATQAAAVQAGAHGVIHGGAAELQGGDFWQGFATGVLSSATGSALANQHALVQFGGSVVAGGLTSRISGGSFVDGAISAAIISGANHLAHEFDGGAIATDPPKEGDDVIEGQEIIELEDGSILYGTAGGKYAKMGALRDPNAPLRVIGDIGPLGNVGPGGPVKLTIRSFNFLVKQKGVWKWAINGRTASKETLRKLGQAKPNLTTSRGKGFAESQDVLRKITPKTQVPKSFFGKVNYYFGKALEFFQYDGLPPGL